MELVGFSERYSSCLLPLCTHADIPDIAILGLRRMHKAPGWLTGVGWNRGPVHHCLLTPCSAVAMVLGHWTSASFPDISATTTIMATPAAGVGAPWACFSRVSSMLRQQQQQSRSLHHRVWLLRELAEH